jgi:hypothetical protein
MRKDAAFYFFLFRSCCRSSFVYLRLISFVVVVPETFYETITNVEKFEVRRNGIKEFDSLLRCSFEEISLTSLSRGGGLAGLIPFLFRVEDLIVCFLVARVISVSVRW